MRILWLSPRWPFPPNDGAKVASASLMEALARAGYQIDVLVIGREPCEGEPPHGSISLIKYFKLNGENILWRISGTLFSSLPFSVKPFVVRELGWKALRDLLPADPSFVLVDGAHVYASFLEKRTPWPVVYRAHNIEHQIWRSAAERSGFPLRTLLLWQAEKMQRFERRLMGQCSGVLAISPEDLKEFQCESPEVPVEWVPPGFVFKNPSAIPEGPPVYGFIGRFDWPPNREGFRWLLERVWPEVRRRNPAARLLVAGKGSLDSCSSGTNDAVERLGEIPNLEEFYSRIHAALAPIPYGGGTKIKVVEAARYGRSFLATSNAFYGSGLPRESALLVSDDPGEWIRVLATSGKKDFQERAALAFEQARRSFDTDMLAKRFVEFVDARLKGNPRSAP